MAKTWDIEWRPIGGATTLVEGLI